MKEKIKLNYDIEIYTNLTYHEIETEVTNFKKKKEHQLIKAGVQDKFEIVAIVKMPLESISIR